MIWATLRKSLGSCRTLRRSPAFLGIVITTWRCGTSGNRSTRLVAVSSALRLTHEGQIRVLQLKGTPISVPQPSQANRVTPKLGEYNVVQLFPDDNFNQVPPRLVTRAAGRSAGSIAILRERLPLALRERVTVSAKNRAFETADDSPKTPFTPGVQPGSIKIALAIDFLHVAANWTMKPKLSCNGPRNALKPLLRPSWTR